MQQTYSYNPMSNNSQEEHNDMQPLPPFMHSVHPSQALPPGAFPQKSDLLHVVTSLHSPKASGISERDKLPAQIEWAMGMQLNLST